jgi:ribosomal protein L37AE/L43A
MLTLNDTRLRAIMDRHEFLCRNPPHCAFCGTDQVQLKLRTPPAEWKCRICKRHFKFEPKARDGQGADK